jgi:hypothetical protein
MPLCCFRFFDALPLHVALVHTMMPNTTEIPVVQRHPPKRTATVDKFAAWFVPLAKSIHYTVYFVVKG